MSMRKKVGVFFLSEPKDFDEFACKFLIGNLNKVQTYFEFVFPEQVDYLESTFSDDLFEEFKQLTSKFPEQYFVGITTPSFKDNLFWNKEGKLAIITTYRWGKDFAPPSVFEYIVSCILGSLVQMVTDKEGKSMVGSHRETKGCLLDYCFFKDDFRVKIPTGLICDDCKAAIKTSMGEDFLLSVEKMWDFKKWLGEPDNPETVAYNMKKFFKVDLYKDTGFYKSGWDKFKEALTDSPKDILVGAAIAIITVIVTYFVTH
jgi:hypothetical protein